MRLPIDARVRRLLPRAPRFPTQNARFSAGFSAGFSGGFDPYAIARLVLIGLIAWALAALGWRVVTPVGPLGNWRPVAAAPSGDPVAILRGFDAFTRLGGGQQAQAVVTSLNLTLFGTRINEAAGGGSAIIAGPDGVQKSVVVGEEVAPGVRLKAVAFDHVTLDRGGVDEDLFIDQSGAVQPVNPGGTPGPDAAAAMPSAPPASAALAPPPAAAPVVSARNPGAVTLAQVRSDIGVIPRVDGGRVSGLAVRAQGSGEAFRAAGLRDGDIITAIAGRAVTGRGDMDRLASQFAAGGAVPITVERGNGTLSLTLMIAGQ